jgi:hypothetical protein
MPRALRLALYAAAALGLAAGLCALAGRASPRVHRIVRTPAHHP